MRRFIVTGPPGAEKTAILRQLELDGFSVVEEAAPDVLAAAHAQGTVEAWRDPARFDLVSVKPGSLKERVNLIKAAIRRAS